MITSSLPPVARSLLWVLDEAPCGPECWSTGYFPGIDQIRAAAVLQAPSPMFEQIGQDIAEGSGMAPELISKHTLVGVGRWLPLLHGFGQPALT
jgi:hypothetical protein